MYCCMPLFVLRQRTGGREDGKKDIEEVTEAERKPQTFAVLRDKMLVSMTRRAKMEERNEMVEELMSDVFGLEVLLRIYANTYHKKELKEITETEWKEQREALRGIIKAAEQMKQEAMQRIGGRF